MAEEVAEEGGIFEERKTIEKYSWGIQLWNTFKKYSWEILTECNNGMVEEGAEEGGIFEERKNYWEIQLRHTVEKYI